MTDAGNFKLDYPVREWVPGHWKDEEEPMSKPRVIFNIGLPRTGTTSIGKALKELGFEQKLPVASRIDWKRVRLDMPSTARFEGPVICTYREISEWLASAAVYRPNAATGDLRALYEDHMHWVAQLDQVVGWLDVRHGYGSLFRALERALDGAYALPHLNQRSRLK